MSESGHSHDFATPAAWLVDPNERTLRYSVAVWSTTWSGRAV